MNNESVAKVFVAGHFAKSLHIYLFFLCGTFLMNKSLDETIFLQINQMANFEYDIFYPIKNSFR